MDKRSLARKNIETRVSPLRSIVTQRPQRGWVRAIREALGMTTEQLAKRIGVSQPRIIALEKAESDDVVMLRTLRDAAAAMECELVYMLVPRRPLDEIVRARAERRANEELSRLHHTMQLENQWLARSALEAERTRMVESLIGGPGRRLWDDV
jgi:predicted DNA-binding mobile mystery protein A